MEIKNRHVFVTGSNRGMGKEMALASARRGAHVHVVNRSEDKNLIALLNSLGAASATYWHLDVGNVTSINDFYRQIEQKNQSVDVLINNAGQLTGGIIETQSPEEIVSMLNVNLVGLILLTRLVLPQMLKRKSGKIVNNASVSGRMFFPGASTYAASKAGVVAFTECIKQELRGTGVSTLLMITPGVKTDMYDKIPEKYSANLDVSFLNSMPADKWAELVVRAIENDKEEIGPQTLSEKMMMGMAVHSTGLFERLVATKFKR